MTRLWQHASEQQACSLAFTTSTSVWLKNKLLLTACRLLWVTGGSRFAFAEVQCEKVKKCRKCTATWRMCNQHRATAIDKTGKVLPHTSETPHCTPTHTHEHTSLTDLKKQEGDRNAHTLPRLTFYRSTSPSPSLFTSPSSRKFPIKRPSVLTQRACFTPTACKQSP